MAEPKKIVFIISDTGVRDKIVAYFWYARYLKKKKYQISFIILNGNHTFRQFLDKENIPYNVLNYTGKNKLDWLIAFLRTWHLLVFRRPDVIHTHYFDANLIGLLAAKFAIIRKRIYTRHHGSLSHYIGHKPVFWDKVMNRSATKIIAVSQNVKNILIDLDRVRGDKVEIIHHGLDFNEMDHFDIERVNAIREKYQFPEDKKIIGVVSAYLKLKGVDYIIKAFKNCLKKRKDIFLVIANAHGADEKEMKKLLTEIPQEYYREIIYENDVFALFKTFSVFVHVPINASLEAFGQVYIEALACRVPSVFTLSGIAPEFIEDGKNALVVDFANAEQIEKAILHLLTDEKLRLAISEKGYQDVRTLFDVSSMIDKMEKLYFS